MAFEWQKGLLGFIPEKDWLEIPFDPARPNDPFSVLINHDKTENIAASYQTIANEYLIPVMAQFHGFDTESRTSFRVPVDTRSVEKGLIKTKINQSELMREYQKSGVIESSKLYDFVISDGARLAEQVITRTYVANGELLSTGKVTIKENNLDITIDYGVKAEQTNLVIDLSPEADIVEQITTIIETAKDAGVTLNGIILASKTLAKMRSNRSMQIAVNGVNSAGTTLRNTAIKTFLSEEFGINSVIMNDELYNVEDGIGEDGRPKVKPIRYFPDDKITFFSKTPSGKLITGLWGDPPEVTNKLAKPKSASGVSPYVYVTQYAEDDPSVVWTKASALYIPVLLNPSSLYITTVTEDTVTEDGA